MYCVSDKYLWTCVNDSIMSLYDLKVELVRLIPLKSGNNSMRHSSDYVKNSQTGMETVVPPLATFCLS